MTITLRDANLADRDFLREVYRSTRADELAMMPWSEEQRKAFIEFQFNAQDVYYHERFPTAQFSVILQDGNPVGRIYILREEQEIRMLDITVLPQYRGQGIGTYLVDALLDEGKHTRKAVQIFVEPFNPSRLMFERRGFTLVREEGINLLLEWRRFGDGAVDDPEEISVLPQNAPAENESA